MSTISGNSHEQFVCGNYTYKIQEDGTAQIISYSGSDSVLVIPEQLDGKRVTAIEEEAFAECKGLTSITLSNSLIDINQLDFLEYVDHSLREVIVSSDHPTLYCIDGVLFSKSEKILLWYPPSHKGSQYIIPNGTKGILYFTDNKVLESVTIPNSVELIDGNVFQSCINLREIIVSSDHPKYSVIDNVLFEKELVTIQSRKRNTRDVPWNGIPQRAKRLNSYKTYTNWKLSLTIRKISVNILTFSVVCFTLSLS